MIGTAETPLTVAPADGSALTARAAEDIHIQEVLGGLHVADHGQGNDTRKDPSDARVSGLPVAATVLI